MTTGPELLAAFAQLTGIRFALGAHYQQAQAMELAKAGITVRDIEMVVLWTKREIAQPRSKFTAASLQWKVLMGLHGDGNEYGTFQERLGLAQEAVRRGWSPRYKVSADETAPKPAQAQLDMEPRADPALFAAGAAQMRALRERMSGRAGA